MRRPLGESDKVDQLHLQEVEESLTFTELCFVSEGNQADELQRAQATAHLVHDRTPPALKWHDFQTLLAWRDREDSEGRMCRKHAFMASGSTVERAYHGASLDVLEKELQASLNIAGSSQSSTPGSILSSHELLI